MKRKLLYIAVCVAASLGGLEIGRSVYAQISSRSVGFTAIGRNITAADGKQTGERIFTESFLADGSFIHIDNSFNGQATGWKSIIDVANRRRIVLDPGTSSVTTYPMTESEYAAATKPPTCSGPDAGQILGYRVVQTSDISPLNTPASRHVQSLLAPDLNCYPLYITKDLVDSSGKVIAHQETHVTAVLKGEIAKSELAVPAAYKERSPSEVRTIRAQQEQRQCSGCEVSGNTILDKAYQAHK